MLIPTKSSDLCPSKLLHPRSFTSDVVSTAESFKSWDTCMNNTGCKIVAIVGIALAAVVVIWLLSGIVRCLCCGARGFCEGLCCACCTTSRATSRATSQFVDRQPLNKESVYDNPNMYPNNMVYENSQFNSNNAYTPMHYGPGTVQDNKNY